MLASVPLDSALVNVDECPSPSTGAGDSSAQPESAQHPSSQHPKRKRVNSANLHPSGGSGASSLATLADSSVDAAANKGLKHFSLKVCEKVEGKGSTNYNEVADELVRDMAADAAAGLGEGVHDEKNVRRRVYDALNVLEALGIIAKNKRDIEWIGWPIALQRSNSEKGRLEAERARVAARVQGKVGVAEDASAKAFCLSNLVLRNRDAPLCALLAAQQAGMPAPNPLALPFMLVHAPGVADVDIHITPDERTARLDFHHWPFQLFDDERVMRMMGLGEPQPELAEGILSLHLQREDAEGPGGVSAMGVELPDNIGHQRNVGSLGSSGEEREPDQNQSRKQQQQLDELQQQRQFYYEQFRDHQQGLLSQPIPPETRRVDTSPTVLVAMPMSTPGKPGFAPTFLPLGTLLPPSSTRGLSPSAAVSAMDLGPPYATGNAAWGGAGGVPKTATGSIEGLEGGAGSVLRPPSPWRAARK